MSVLTENDPQVMEAYYEFQHFTSDPQTREFARRRHLFEIDRQMSIRAAEKEAAAKAKAETEAKWQADKIETARKLKLLSVDCEKIAQATGLSLNEIEHLN
ncbi:MAG: hypothetical protein LBC02_11280 [Planctomycetaceae bacterium]|jgi:predicted transposase/invertase (TIGR01784 family)|nr:hypothetical protein [Planctomycetaceae bacterium]